MNSIIAAFFSFHPPRLAAAFTEEVDDLGFTTPSIDFLYSKSFAFTFTPEAINHPMISLLP